jgi:hypothetical protein
VTLALSVGISVAVLGTRAHGGHWLRAAAAEMLSTDKSMQKCVGAERNIASGGERVGQVVVV